MTERRPHTESELVEFVRSIDVRAPEELHRKVGSLIAARSSGDRRRGIPVRAFGDGRFRFGLGLAGAIAVAVVAAIAIAVGLGSGGAHPLSLREASALTLHPATLPPPAENPRHNGQLVAAADGVPFPYWEDRFGWRSTGARSDRVAGRTVATVFYRDGRGRRLGYAIVAGTPAPHLSGGTVVWRGGVPYRLSAESGTHVISWLRDGRLCVVAGRGVDSATLLQLASWTERRSVAS